MMSILPRDQTDEEIDEEADKAAVFVQEFIKTHNAIVACSRAGIRDARYTMDVVAERTLARPEIRAAIRALEKIEISSQPIEVSRETICADMDVVYEKALDDRQYGSAISAKKLQSALLGFLVSKMDITHRVSVDTMTDDQLLRIATRDGGKIIDVDSSEIDDEDL